jgi:hypothetical protein
MKNIFKEVENWFEKVFTDAPAWEHVAITTLNVVTPPLQLALTLADPAAIPIVEPILNTIKMDLGTVVTTLNSAGATPTVGTLLTATQENLTALEAAADIKNPDSKAKLAEIIETAQVAIASVVLMIPQAVPPEAPPPATGASK